MLGKLTFPESKEAGKVEWMMVGRLKAKIPKGAIRFPWGFWLIEILDISKA